MKKEERRRLGCRSQWVVGADLGQSRDPSAVVALEAYEATYDERDPVTYSFVTERTYRVRGVQKVRLGTPYPDVVQHLRDVANLPELRGKCTLVVDATGVGKPVVDLLRAIRPQCRVVPVVITGADQEGSDGSVYRVPKRDLMTGLQVVISQRRLEIAARSRGRRSCWRNWGRCAGR